MRRALPASCAVHLVALLCVLLMTDRRRPAVPGDAVAAEQRPRIVWLNVPGPGGGGGGGGNRMKEPPRPAESPGRDAVTVPVAPAPSAAAKIEPEHQAVQELTIPAKPLAAALESLAGAIDAPPAPPTLSQGPGSEGGSGTGRGPGSGPGDGPGLGPGRGGNTGGGAYQPGGGVIPPTAIRRGIPRYTADAMRARMQGVVMIECIVQTNGVCTNVRVVHGLEPSFGLNDEAVKAAEEWRFRPGTRLGEPVPVIVTMEITFTIR